MMEEYCNSTALYVENYVSPFSRGEDFLRVYSSGCFGCRFVIGWSNWSFCMLYAYVGDLFFECALSVYVYSIYFVVGCSRGVLYSSRAFIA